MTITKKLNTMKKLLFLATLAAALLCSCGKDNPEGNFVKLGDVTVPVTHAMCTVADHGGFQAVVMDFDGEENGVNIHGFPRLGPECVGKKLDLAKFDGSVNYTLEINTIINSKDGVWPGLYNLKEQGNQSCWTETQNFGEGTCFKKGTLKLTKEKSGNYTIDLDGTLLDGRIYIWHITAEYVDPEKF